MRLGRSSSGFTLLEVLISVIVLSIGILGVAGLQLFALRANQVSYQRSQAVILAADMSDRMRANRAAAAAGAYILDPGSPPAAPDASACVTASCNSAAMAARDVSVWYQLVTDTLPGGTARIVCGDTPCTFESLYTVSVLWDEDRTGAEETTCPDPDNFNAEVDLTCLTVSVQP